ncbi:UMP kinase, partial [bacterium]|nr:UMP kinase [bacterium]
MSYRRILLKVSGEAMLAKDGRPIDQEFLSYLANEIKPVVEAGVQVAIVVGGGNIFRGLSANTESGLDRVTGDNMGMLATMINSLALKAAFEAHG